MGRHIEPAALEIEPQPRGTSLANASCAPTGKRPCKILSLGLRLLAPMAATSGTNCSRRPLSTLETCDAIAPGS